MNLRVTDSNSSSLTFSWDPPTDADGLILEYRVTDHNSVVNTVDGRQTSFTLNGLLPYREYSVEVTARNAMGYGNASTISGRTLQEGEYTDFSLFLGF